MLFKSYSPVYIHTAAMEKEQGWTRLMTCFQGPAGVLTVTAVVMCCVVCISFKVGCSAVLLRCMYHFKVGYNVLIMLIKTN